MIVQTDSEIAYTTDRWRGAADGSMTLVLAAVFLLPLILWICFDGRRAFEAPAGALIIIGVLALIGGGLAALAYYLGFRRVGQPDSIVITTGGLTYTRFGTTRAYSWPQLGDAVYSSNGRGPGSVRMKVDGEGNLLKIIPDDFGIECRELMEAIEAARRGTLISAADLHAKVLKSTRQINLVFLFLSVVLFGSLIMVAVFTKK
ncbi:hypothetical protein NED98_10710 [Sphingomonas sp. MMSM20]|uniref:hypothetical protein n=1 Tax=Sphingomonas lycopersici TaxID=2951807 RepID=UPI002238AC7E|nr:hypothetical protein [Sphingomonas lycopersici]MCW6530715.1 hypothetical protein [Sphingomonas lycopersici]